MSSAAITREAQRGMSSVGSARSWRRAIVLPREHGAWGMLILPLICGAAVGYAYGGRGWTNLAAACIAAIAVFLLRTPAEALLRTSIVRPANQFEKSVASCALAFCLAVITIAVLALSRTAIMPYLLPAGFAVFAFAAQTMLRKLQRRNHTVNEITGAVVLSSGAYVSYYAITGRVDRMAISLWVLNSILSCDQVLYVRTRIAMLAGQTEANRKLSRARVIYALVSALSLGVLLLGAWYALFPFAAFAAFVPLICRSWWAGRFDPATPNLRATGWTEIGISMTSLFLLVNAFALHVH